MVYIDKAQTALANMYNYMYMCVHHQCKEYAEKAVPFLHLLDQPRLTEEHPESYEEQSTFLHTNIQRFTNFIHIERYIMKLKCRLLHTP